MSFSDFLGNAKAVGVVRGMLASGHMPGALLFSGPDGVGKKTAALMLARALNCERLKDDYCGECRHCRKAEEMLSASRQDMSGRREIKDSGRRVEGLVYFDLQVIEPISRFILIEQIRQLRNVAYTRPFELSRRVFVIDEAQAIHWQAVDLLLKVLEEPPDTTTFILVCPNAYELRPTIRSRCERVQFLPAEDEVIEKILEQEGRLKPAERTLGVRLAEGSVAKAKSLDLADFERRRHPWLEFLDGAVSVAGRGPREAPPNWSRLFDATKALSEDREGFEDTLRVGYTLLADLLQVGEDPPGARLVNLDLKPRLETWSKRLGIKGIERLKDGLDEAYRLQSRNVNQQLGLDVLALDLFSL